LKLGSAELHSIHLTKWGKPKILHDKIDLRAYNTVDDRDSVNTWADLLVFSTFAIYSLQLTYTKNLCRSFLSLPVFPLFLFFPLPSGI
jgi:hypothetical protein